MKAQVLIVLTFIFFVGPRLSTAQLTSTQIDKIVERTLSTFNVPGIAVGVIKDGKLVHAKGYGVRSLRSNDKVDESTLFGVASNSKAFTTAAISMLVDEGKLGWDDLVTDYVPEFKLYNPYVSSVFTITDLVTHRSGLGLGAGDLMFWPDSSNFSVKDIIHNLRYLKQTSQFRTKYDYDNLLYIVAGEVINRLTGQTWEEFIESRIMKPLQMSKSAASYERLSDKTNVIDPHAPVDGTIKVIKRDWSTVANAAGGIYSNITDLSKWLLMQLNNGKYGDQLQYTMFSQEMQEQMWTPKTIIPVIERNRSVAARNYNTHFNSYGLGWFISDVKGYKQMSHSGGLAGTVTLITLIPELKLGIIVLTNQQSGAAFNAVTNSIKDGYLGIQGNDWIKVYDGIVKADHAAAAKILKEVESKINSSGKTIAKEEADRLKGSYTDPWFGEVVISERGSSLWMESLRSPRLRGELFFYKGNTYIIKWKDRSFDADAWVTFTRDDEGKATGMKWKAISPLTDFSFDFHDLDFSKKL
jgi:CubicO group peptidase (beta-lactamase class C family)